MFQSVHWVVFSLSVLIPNIFVLISALICDGSAWYQNNNIYYLYKVNFVWQFQKDRFGIAYIYNLNKINILFQSEVEYSEE